MDLSLVKYSRTVSSLRLLSESRSERHWFDGLENLSSIRVLRVEYECSVSEEGKRSEKRLSKEDDFEKEERSAR